MAKHPALWGLFIALLCGAPLIAHATDLVDATGFGPVKFGMTIKQAERALGTTLKLTADEDPSGTCVRGGRADGIEPGVAYMAIKGVIQRIDVELAQAQSVKTAGGVGAGSTPSDVRKTFGARAEHDNTDYAGDDDIVVNAPGRKSGVRYGFEDGKLSWIIAGKYAALSFSEGCL